MSVHNNLHAKLWRPILLITFLLSSPSLVGGANNKEVLILASSPRRTMFSEHPKFSIPKFSNPQDDFDFDPNFIQHPELPDDYRDGTEEENRLPHSPVIYRYYGKRRSRTRASGSIPFILLGSNVEHWRAVGEHLSARGFSVIACERDPLEGGEEEEEDDDGQKTEQKPAYSRWTQDEWWGEDEEAAALVSNVLQASRWSKAILVACDSEAVLAIQAAFRLAPEKIAGLVLCGDLKEVDSLLEQSHPDLIHSTKNFAIDAFLNRLLPCPFAIAWDGETTTPVPSEYDGSSPAECLDGNRCFILGGGIAPHRRQPETFAWTLTRFVEDKVAPSLPIDAKRKFFRHVRRERRTVGLPPVSKGLKQMFSHTIFSGDFFSSGSFVVYGRIIASALLYGSVLKVAIYQYGNFLDGAVNLKTRHDMLRNLKGRIVAMISGFFVNFGYIPLLFKRKEPNPELDPLDFVTSLERDDGNFEHGDDVKGVEEDVPKENSEEEEEIEDESSEQKQESIESEGEGAGEGESEETTVDTVPPEEESEEKEEERVFQPLFFLDRVIAAERSYLDMQQRRA